MDNVIERVKYLCSKSGFDFFDVFYMLKYFHDVCKKDGLTLDEMYDIFYKYVDELYETLEPDEDEDEDDDWYYYWYLDLDM